VCTKSEPKDRYGLILGSQAAPGYCGPYLSRGYLKSVTGDLMQPWQGMRGLCEEYPSNWVEIRFESPSLPVSEHLT
jgi:hypothetical protein